MCGFIVTVNDVNILRIVPRIELYICTYVYKCKTTLFLLLTYAVVVVAGSADAAASVHPFIFVVVSDRFQFIQFDAVS